MGLDVSVALALDRLGAVTKIPLLFAVGRSECPHLERYRVAGADPERRRIGGMNSRWQILWTITVDDLNEDEVIVGAPLGIGDAQDFAEFTRLWIFPLKCRAVRLCAVAERPLVAGDLSGGARRFAAVESRAFAGKKQVMRTSDRLQQRFVLAAIGFPQKSVSRL